MPVVADPKLKRADAVVALQTMSQFGDDGQVERIVYAGQLVARDDPLVLLNPYNVRLPSHE